ncbi:MAG: hypothetical protein KF700_04650 [Hyphomonadaceae bacterium]|nr:hypothetical protein [Hyphomonadaceae bacterium]
MQTLSKKIGRAAGTVRSYANGFVPPSAVQDDIELETRGAVTKSVWADRLEMKVKILSERAFLAKVKAG